MSAEMALTFTFSVLVGLVLILLLLVVFYASSAWERLTGIGMMLLLVQAAYMTAHVNWGRPGATNPYAIEVDAWWADVPPWLYFMPFWAGILFIAGGVILLYRALPFEDERDTTESRG